MAVVGAGFLVALLFSTVILFASALLGVDPASHIPFLQHGFLYRRLKRQRSSRKMWRCCPGYTLSSIAESDIGLTAALTLAGPACNAFGTDVADLAIEVTYDSPTRLHVNIYDKAQAHFTVPKSVIDPPPAPGASYKAAADLVFNYDAAPFAFWITRRAEPDAAPLFDTRVASLPRTPVAPFRPGDERTALKGFPLVFEDRYLQLTSALPHDANIYGLGEAVASAGFRRDVGAHGGVGTVQTLWARDGEWVDDNVYGTHPFYVEHRYNASSSTSASHGVFLNSAAGADVLLTTPPASNVTVIEYRALGGTLDLYFFAGPSVNEVAEQYAEVVGTPAWQPAWAFGFQQCRWGYKNLEETEEVVHKMREAGIPLEVMWNDIDLYHAVRDFTADPVSYPVEEMRAFLRELKANDQHYIPIVDAAIPKTVNATDVYHPYTKGVELDTFIKNPDGSEYVGQVWPGYTVFPDWFAPNTSAWWAEALANWSAEGIEFSGIWLDMNEGASFCEGSCGSKADISNTTPPFILPGEPGNPQTAYPEGYNATLFGPSGNLTVNGTSTCDTSLAPAGDLKDRGLGAPMRARADTTAPAYAIHNAFGSLSANTLAINATHYGGHVELDAHSLWGTMEAKATRDALLQIHPGERPYIISRSTFAGAGKFGGHWLGDNYSLWSYLHYTIQGVLQFQLFQIPMVGVDTCGFSGNADEELCNRWMQLSAFTPFFRNHNIKGSIPQEPYVWDSVAEASRKAIDARYKLLPYWYSLFANASLRGTPPVRALWFEFPNEPELYGNDRQFLIGRDVLVSPVLTPCATTVDAVLPGHGTVVWRDWWTHDVVAGNFGANTTLSAPLGHINVHIRDGAALLLHATSAYTIAETRAQPYSLLVSLTTDGHATGAAYVDDGISEPPSPSTTLAFNANNGRLTIEANGEYIVATVLEQVTLLGVSRPSAVRVGGATLTSGEWSYAAGQQKLVLDGLNVSLNEGTTIEWS